MKSSRYNYILYSDSHSYWYNTLTHSFFRLSKGLGEKIEGLSGDIEQLREAAPTYFEKLVNFGFVVEDDFDELEALRLRHRESVNKKDYFLIILPTLNCNYSCWYCIQDHISSVMSEETMESIKRHIEYMIDVEKIESLHLEWFGGEPFMFFNRVVEPLSRFALELCEKKGIPFRNGATTNGYFISNEIIPQLKELKFVQFQITLDGEKQFHDKVKFTKGCESTFEHVLRNINDILVSNEDTTMILRINYTHETLTPKIVEQVNQFISESVRKRVVITPKKVWQENTDKDFGPTLIEIKNLFRQSGYT
ncbi:MAG: radical SAM protein, partial [Muribaculaceae bacterium]|nr:radical SAM protein [Muribaculaceae bacterium]